MKSFLFVLFVLTNSVLTQSAFALDQELFPEGFNPTVDRHGPMEPSLTGVVSDTGVFVGIIQAWDDEALNLTGQLSRLRSRKIAVYVVLKPETQVTREWKIELVPGGIETKSSKHQIAVKSLSAFLPDVKNDQTHGTRLKWEEIDGKVVMTSGREELENIVGELGEFRTIQEGDVQLPYLDAALGYQSFTDLPLFTLSRIKAVYWDKHSRRLFRINEPLFHQLDEYDNVRNWTAARAVTIWTLPDSNYFEKQKGFVNTQFYNHIQLEPGIVSFPGIKRFPGYEPKTLAIKIFDDEVLVISNYDSSKISDTSRQRALAEPIYMNNDPYVQLVTMLPDGTESAVTLERLDVSLLNEMFTHSASVWDNDRRSVEELPADISYEQLHQIVDGDVVHEVPPPAPPAPALHVSRPTYNGHQVISWFKNPDYVLVQLTEDYLAFMFTKEDGGKDQVQYVVPGTVGDPVEILESANTIALKFPISRRKFVYRMPGLKFIPEMSCTRILESDREEKL